LLGSDALLPLHSSNKPQQPATHRSANLVSGYNESRAIEPIFVSVKEAAQALSVSPWSVYRLCESGTITSVKRGNRRLVAVRSLREYADTLLEAEASA
jgi:excisionase family DNA binding protein